MDAATTLEAVKAAGAVLGLTDEGRLSIDFGEAEVEPGLLDAVRTHADIFRSLLGAKPAPAATLAPVAPPAGPGSGSCSPSCIGSSCTAGQARPAAR
jgi:hypothetical protein